MCPSVTFWITSATAIVTSVGTRSTETWKPSSRVLIILFLSLYTPENKRTQDFATDARVPISEATMVTTGTKHAIQCGDFTDAWKEWNRRPDAKKTWPTWKTHWTRAFHENRDIQGLTGSTFRHQAHSTVEDELSENFLLSHENLDNTAIQKNNMVKKLVITNNLLTVTNQKLTKHVTKLQEQNSKLLNILEKYASGGTGRAVGKIFAQAENNDVWDPAGYCWTHGFKVKKGHNSKTCKTRGAGHQEGATGHNTMGGSLANDKWTPKT
jgi:hypothetical protein